MKYQIISIIFILRFLIGCSSTENGAIDKYNSNLYSVIEDQLSIGNYPSVMRMLEAMDQQDPFGPYAKQILLDLIFSYYKSFHFALARQSIDRFIEYYPTSMHIMDYVLYLRGLINMECDRFKRFLYIDRIDHNPAYAIEACRDFSQLIRDYPHSKYRKDACIRLIYLKDRLAKNSLTIVKYYEKKGAYIAVVNRVEYMLRHFPDTKATYQALPYIEKSYRHLRLYNQAAKIKNNNIFAIG